MDINPKEERFLGNFSQADEASLQLLLASKGFTAEEIVWLQWLRHWYQNGGSDRSSIIRHLEFLRRLVLSGKFER